MLKTMCICVFIVFIASCSPSATFIPTKSPTITRFDASSGCKLTAILGQSNATGEGYPTQLTDQSLALTYPATFNAQVSAGPVDPPVWLTHTGLLEPWKYDGSRKRMGVEITMGRDLDAVSPGMYPVVKYAMDSTSLAVQWLATGHYPASQPTNLAHQAIAWVEAQRAALGCDTVAIVWIQGERDAQVSAYSNAYKTNLINLVALSRVTWPGAGWVIGRLNIQHTMAPMSAYTVVIRTAEQDFVMGDSHAILVDQDFVSLDPADYTHYLADGYADLGHAYASAVLSL